MAFKNEFSYSKSRFNFLKSCEWKYYLHYYYSFGGWNSDRNSNKFKAWKLKKVYTKPAWVGVVTHKLIKSYIVNQLIKKTPNDIDKFLAYATDQISQKFDSSLVGIYTKNKDIVLREHHFNSEISFDEVASAILGNLVNFIEFFNANLYGIVSKENVLCIDEDGFNQFFIFNGVKIYSIIDFAFFTDETINIYDWKTGKVLDTNLDQLLIYALYFIDVYTDYNLMYNNFNLSEYNTAKGALSINKLTPNSITDIKLRLSKNIKTLSSYLVNSDIDRNIADESKFQKFPSKNNCDNCPFIEICL